MRLILRNLLQKGFLTNYKKSGKKLVQMKISQLTPLYYPDTLVNPDTYIGLFLATYLFLEILVIVEVEPQLRSPKMTKLWRGYKTSFWRIFFSSVMITLTKVCLSQLRFLHVFLALGHYARDMFASKTDQKRKQQKGESTCPRYTLRRNQLSSGK